MLVSPKVENHRKINKPHVLKLESFDEPLQVPKKSSRFTFKDRFNEYGWSNDDFYRHFDTEFINN